MQRKVQRVLAFVGVAALTVAAAACGGDSSDGSSASSDTATTIAPLGSDAPVSDPPATAERIVALDETAALSLLTLGIEPTIVLTTLSSEMFVPIAESLALETAPFSVAEPALEYLASLDADRIVAMGNPFVLGRLRDFEAIAPVTLIAVDGTWQDQLSKLADSFGVADRAVHLIGRVEEGLDELTAALAADGAAGSSVSVLTAQGDMVIATTGNSPSGSVLSALGFTRPAAQAEGSKGLPYVPLTLETLDAHDADALILPSGSLFSSAPITSSPLYPTLGAVKHGHVVEVAAEPWIVGGSAFATWWIAADLEAVFVADTTPATAADSAARWNQFTALTA